MTGDRLIVTEKKDGFYAVAIPAEIRFFNQLNREARKNQLLQEQQEAEDAAKYQADMAKRQAQEATRKARMAKQMARQEARRKAVQHAFIVALANMALCGTGVTVLAKLTFMGAIAGWLAALLAVFWAVFAGSKVGRLLQIMR